MIKNIFNKLSKEEKIKRVEMHPLGLSKPDDIANTCAFLLADASHWITELI